MLKQRLTSITLLAGLSLAATGCHNYLHLQFPQKDSASLDTRNGPGQAVTTPSAWISFKCTDTSLRGMSEAGLRRLTRAEFLSTMGDLVGSDIISGDAAIQNQIGLMPKDTLKTAVTDIGPNPGESSASALQQIAARIGTLVTSDSALRDRIFGACSGMGSVPDSCAQSFIQNFGFKVLRRPPTAAENADLMSYYQASGKNLPGLKKLLQRILQAPSLVYHLEMGTVSSAGRVRLTDYEVASRLSYRLTGGMPDSTLLAAASRGELQSLANVKAQAARIMSQSPGAKAKMNDFIQYYLQTGQYSDPASFAGQDVGIDTKGLHDEMVQEAMDFVNNVIWNRHGDFNLLMTSQEVFPRSSRMATILETNVANGNTPSQTSAAHAGILLRPGFLASSSPRTNIPHRGVLVRKRILCDQIGSPDPLAVKAAQDQLGELNDVTNRERFVRLTAAPSCASCHTQISPIGDLLEGYNHLGMVRTIETVFDTHGTKLGTQPIDTRVDRPNVDFPGQGPSSVADAQGLVQALANGTKARACFIQTMYEFQRLRGAVTADNCGLSEGMGAATNHSSILDTYLMTIANEDIFYRKAGN